MSNPNAAPTASSTDATRLKFAIEHESPNSKARAAQFHTLHGVVETPVFMPVGTQATVKAQTVDSLSASGTRILLANTYHLLLRPGPRVFQQFGGIHRFMQWHGPVLTDSGGFQIFSLPHARAIDETGARFQSYIDGKAHLLSPESSIEMQKTIGADIMMALDLCIPATADYKQAEAAMQLTHRWAERSLRARGDGAPALFGIVQGACHDDLRNQSAEFLSQLSFDGLAIGGLAVGESPAERYRVTGLVTDALPRDKPRYLMGVGTPSDILECVHRGIDMFDCIIPSQLAQRGVGFTSQGKLQLRRSVYKFVEEPLDARCRCLTCRQYSRAYLHHLVKADEYLGWHFLGLHNLTFYHDLMREMREHILRGEFVSYYREKRGQLAQTDESNPTRPPKRARHQLLPRRGDYEAIRSPTGFFTIRQISSGEVMHSVTAPDDEANQLYVEQTAFAQRLSSCDSGEELVVWDVGLGAAFNAMALIRCFERCYAEANRPAIRPVRLVSFENDLDSLALAASHPAVFSHMRHSAPSKILDSGGWQHCSSLLRWELHKGDFRELMAAAPAAQIILYDPFSYKTNAELWTRAVFTQVFERCAAKSAELYTYSASTAVRVALLTAGFHVASGVGSGPKNETTIAFTDAAAAFKHPLKPPLLDDRWLRRWQRSEVKFPADLALDKRPAFESLIESHPQFSAAAADSS